MSVGGEGVAGETAQRGIDKGWHTPGGRRGIAPRVSAASGEPSAPVSRIGTIELGRGLAAAAVAVFHADVAADWFGGPHARFASIGEHGVDFFFVLSGFIILVAHHRDIGRTGAGRTYALKRIIRLVPLLWLVVLGVASAALLLGQPHGVRTVARSLLLWPSTSPTLPRVVWTLRHEALFYAAFLVLIVRPRAGWLLFAGLALASVAQAIAALAGRPATGVAAMLLSSYNLQFLMGMGVARFYLRGALRAAWLLPAGVAAAAAVLAAGLWFDVRRLATSDYVSPIATWWTMVLGAAFAALLCGLLAIDRRVTMPRWALTLGGASYAVYLVHTPFNSIAQRAAQWLPRSAIDAGGGQVLLVAGGIAAGLLVHLWIETPLTRRLRNRWLPLDCEKNRSR